MYRESYGHMNIIRDIRNLTFSQFIRTPYFENCAATQHNTEMRRVCRQDPMEVASNMIQIRTLKYKNWLYLNPALDFGQSSDSLYYRKRSHVRYESVLDDGQELAIRQFFEQHNIDMLPKQKEQGQANVRYERKIEELERDKDQANATSFHKVTGSASWNGEMVDTFVPKSHLDILSKYYSKDDIRYVLDNLDRQFESDALNYTYSYVDDYLKLLDKNRRRYIRLKEMSRRKINSTTTKFNREVMLT